MRIAVKMQNGIEEQDVVHQEAIYLMLSLDMVVAWKPLCLSIVRTSLRIFVGGECIYGL
jgi:hypothetical protein